VGPPLGSIGTARVASFEELRQNQDNTFVQTVQYSTSKLLPRRLAHMDEDGGCLLERSFAEVAEQDVATGA
jgi:hypothetical protein